MTGSSMMSVRSALRVRRLTTGVLIGLLFILPVLYMVLISLQTPQEFGKGLLRIPTSPQFSNFKAAWTQADLTRQLLNTAIYAFAAAGISTLLSLFAAHAIARRLVRFHSGYYIFMVLGMCLPIPIIPLFIQAQKMHLYDNRIGYIILHVEPGLPLGVILLTAVMTSVPLELEQAAVLDGASYLRYMFQMVLPLAFPGVVIVFLYSFLGVWNDIIGPLVFLASDNLFPVTRGIYQFYGADSSGYPVLAAGIIVVSAPVMILFALSQRRLLDATVGASA